MVIINPIVNRVWQKFSARKQQPIQKFKIFYFVVVYSSVPNESPKYRYYTETKSEKAFNNLTKVQRITMQQIRNVRSVIAYPFDFKLEFDCGCSNELFWFCMMYFIQLESVKHANVIFSLAIFVKTWIHSVNLNGSGILLM